jgi:hypothetical protein
VNNVNCHGQPALDAHGFRMLPVKSSTIAEIGYDVAQGMLAVRFKSWPKKIVADEKDHQQGVDKAGFTIEGQPTSLYHYLNVDQDVYEAILAGMPGKDGKPSIGVAFQKMIKAHPDKHPFRKIENSPGDII